MCRTSHVHQERGINQSFKPKRSMYLHTLAWSMSAYLPYMERLGNGLVAMVLSLTSQFYQGFNRIRNILSHRVRLPPPSVGSPRRSHPSRVRRCAQGTRSSPAPLGPVLSSSEQRGSRTSTRTQNLDSGRCVTHVPSLISVVFGRFELRLGTERYRDPLEQSHEIPWMSPARNTS